MSTAKIPAKREMLARVAGATGITRLLSNLPAQPTLIVLNYHRIGDPEDTPYDPTVFSATASHFQQQMEIVAANCEVVGLDAVQMLKHEVMAQDSPRPRVLITFDDGYIDNYEIAFPILTRLGLPAVFFLPTSYIGTGEIPWWDSIAYMLKHARKRRFLLQDPIQTEFDLDADGFAASLGKALYLRKHPLLSDGQQYLKELAEASDSEVPGAASGRCFMDWEEASRMASAGMFLGAHTVSHRILSQLEPHQQCDEVIQSREQIKTCAGVDPIAFAYPVGLRDCFTPFTQSAVRDAGFQLAFSFYGGINRLPLSDPFDIQRVATSSYSLPQLRLQLALARFARSFAG